MSFLALVLVLALASPQAARAEEGPTAGLLGTRVVDLGGRVHRLGMGTGVQPVALVFLDTGCPIANKYVPELGALAALAAEEGVQFFGVLSDPTVTATAARAHCAEYALAFPVLFDASGELAGRLGPTHVPEAFVLDDDDRVYYRGRIDDRFEDLGKQRAQVSAHDLAAALRGVGERTPLAAARTRPIGCVFEAWSARPADAAVTYHRDVAPILNANCVECHRAGDVGPFPLGTFAEAQRRARTIAEVTRSRLMPPWFAAEGAGHFRDERRLSPGEIARLEAWASAGAPEGDPADALPPPAFPDERWRLGPPDLVVEMPVAYELPAAGDDIYRYFVVPNALLEDRFVTAIDFRPGDPSVVHHCIVYHDFTGKAARIDARTSEPGFSVFGQDSGANEERFDPSGTDSRTQIAGWAPGTQPYVLPPGTGQRLAAGGDFVLEVHYHLTGKATRDRSALALYFADEPVAKEVVGLVIGTENIDIPADEEAYYRHVWMEVPADLELIDVSPHMHYLGKEVEVVATLPDGAEEKLITIADWDFRWQGAYFYRKPVLLPAGSRIDAFFRFDNSAANPANPSRPPIRVREGWRTTDEMCLFYFTGVPRDAAHTDAIYRAMLASFQRSGAPE
ncbi:MAG TPA: redoxin family protein [Planctomycetota bacterium]